MSDMLCLECGREFRKDVEREKAVCPARKCKSANIVDVCEKKRKTCPKCRQGVFKVDPDKWIVS
jgi:ribosomal protein S27AE